MCNDNEKQLDMFSGGADNGKETESDTKFRAKDEVNA